MILTTLADGVRSTLALERGNYLIGRGESCRIRFTSPEVSERHAILTVTDEKAVIEDLHSANGTFVNGDAIDGAVALESTMVVQIGPNLLRVSDDDETGGSGEDEEPQEEEEPRNEGVEETADDRVAADPMRELRAEVQAQIQRELLKRVDMKRLTL